MAYSAYDELASSSACTGALHMSLTDPRAHNLLVAKGDVLDIYRLLSPFELDSTGDVQEDSRSLLNKETPWKLQLLLRQHRL